MISLPRIRARTGTGDDARLDRHAFDLLSLAMAAVVAVHAAHLPVWLTVALGLLLVARWVHRNTRGGRISWWLRLPLTLGLPLAIVAQYGTLFGEEPGSALVAGMLVLKLLETERARDARVGVAFACFGLMSALLFGQGLVATGLVALGLLPTLAALNALQPARPAFSWKSSWLPVLRMLALALPLTLVGFLFIPRLSAPLWGAPSDGPTRTGVSGSMAPGDFTQLLVDDTPAFRVSFDGPRPPRMQRYFRGPVLWRFDGRTWSTAHDASPRLPEHMRPPVEPVVPHGGMHAYQVTLEPTQRHWLFALDTPLAAPHGAHFTPARTLLSNQRIRSIRRYRMRSSTQHVLEPNLSPGDRARALQLPKGFDPKARALAAQWRRQHGGQPRAIVDAALKLFHDGGFSYTLTPPPLGRNSVDDFLFSTRQGFCEHYASAFTFLMRAAGIPARVVTGYQGGYWNAMGHYLLIRQSDAHAWSEVWIAGRGWVRVDPTAAVRPERVDEGAAAAAGHSREWYQAAWLQDLRNRWDIVNRWWNQAVTGFDALRQSGLLKPFGIRHADPTRLGIAFAVGIVTLLALGLGLALWRHHEPDPLRRAMLRLQRKLARLGIERESSEGPRDFLRRAASELPHERTRLESLEQDYLRLRYAGKQSETGSIRTFARRVREFRPRRIVQ
jgi:protein-glutamine gamma-glutamyltransferase